ncbi:MAG: GGDEF domain-containing protein [Acidobacteriaceae bacterium]
MAWPGRTTRRPTDSTSTFRTRTRILALATAVVLASAARADQPTLTTLHAVHTLTLAQARLDIPVAFQATVTYYNPSDVDLFVQDKGEAVYVETKQNQNFRPGDRVLVRGHSRASFTPDVVAGSVTVLHHGSLPQPVPADFQQLIRVQRDCMLVTVHGTVRSADTINFGNTHEVTLRLVMDGGYIDATVIGVDAEMVKDLLDAEVEVTGAVSGKFDSKMQLIGIVLEVPTLADVKIVRAAKISPGSLPVTPMDKVMSAFNVLDRTERVRVQGTITWYQPGSAVVLQNGGHSIWIATHTVEPLEIGDKADATGFPDPHLGFLALADGEIQDSHIYAPVQPAPSNWHDLADWNSGNADGHQNDLVSIDGRVVAAVREQSQDEFDLVSNGKLFTAIYHHPFGGQPLPRMMQVPIGTTIRVTGICMVVQGANVDPSVQEVPFNILLRSWDDIAVIARPSLLSVRNLLLLVGLLVALLFAAGIRAWVVERRMRRQNASAARIERRRSRILEDINGSRPLAAILEQIVELASIRLRGAPCWCQIVDGARLGNCPANLNDWRIIEEPIPGRSGSPLGVLCAAFDPHSKLARDESTALSVAAGLATLAIETRRLYSDLVHRSEFDLLTDVPNRFSLESFLDQLIEQTRQNAGIFGLIYIDLNNFKQINDLYGHQVGDLYLQEVAARMKQQIRGGDMLARIGGDEFAVILPNVRRLAEVEEIAHRLERCLDPPFAAEGYVVHGSASVGIALYPDDGATRDSLLSAADAGMYVNKQTRRRTTTVSTDQDDSGPALDDDRS